MESRSELSAQILELAAGRLSPLVAWWLRRKLRRYPELEKELAETETLYAELRTLRSEALDRPAPDFGAPRNLQCLSAFLTIPIFGGITMHRRVVLGAVVALSLICVTGGYAAVRYFYDPFAQLDAGRGLTWSAQHDFRGEVKFYGADGVYRGSHGTDGTPNASIAATVTVNNETFALQGAGRHELRSEKTGILLGTVELVPQTESEREQFRRKNAEENGIEERLHISYGARDGYGQCIGFFGDAPNRLTWKLSGGDVVVNFFNVKTGHQVYRGTALAVNDSIRQNKRQELSPEAYAVTVADSIPEVPEFSWQAGDKQERHVGYEPFTFTLPHGMELRAQIVPRPH